MQSKVSTLNKKEHFCKGIKTLWQKGNTWCDNNLVTMVSLFKFLIHHLLLMCLKESIGIPLNPKQILYSTTIYPIKSCVNMSLKSVAYYVINKRLSWNSIYLTCNLYLRFSATCWLILYKIMNDKSFCHLNLLLTLVVEKSFKIS